MHGFPWLSPERLPEASMTVLAMVLLLVLSRRHWARLGDGYAQLLTCTLISALCFAALHVIGAWLKIPILIHLSGLRAIVLTAVVGLPVIVLFLWHCVTSDEPMVRFWGAFIFFLIPLGAPYGLDKTPVILLALALLSGVVSIRSEKLIVAVRLLVLVTSVLWGLAWFSL